MSKDPTMVTSFQTAGELLETIAVQHSMVKNTVQMLLSEADYPERIEALALMLLAYLEKENVWLSQMHSTYGDNEMTSEKEGTP